METNKSFFTILSKASYYVAEALEKQRQMYERQMQMLRFQLMSPGTPSMPFPPLEMSKLTPTGVQSGIQRKYQQWALER